VTESTAAPAREAGDGNLELAGEFPAASRQEWQRLVAKVLGDAVTAQTAAEPELLLATMLPDGFEVLPLYTAADGQPGIAPDLGYPGQTPFVRGSNPAGHRSGWDVRQRHAHPDPETAREQIMADLGGGVTSLWLGLGEGLTPIDALPSVLTEVLLDLVTVTLDAGAQTEEAARVFLDTAQRRSVGPDQLSASLGADPIGVAARGGGSVDFGGTIQLARTCATGYPGVRTFVVDGLPFHEAGASDAQELGYALATGVAYLRAMQEAGLGADAAFGQLEFRYAATADQFASIAKLRAARRLWASVAERCGVDGRAAGQRQHAVTSWTMMTRRDPWNNMLRATLAGFAAGVGGADAVTVLPFDAALGQSDDLALRIARNTHALLIDESNISRVIDPAGGSWYVESLTDALAAKAWEWFQVVERAGGMATAVTTGLVSEQIAVTRAARLESLAHRREAITGVSEFPLLDEQVLDRRPAVSPTASAGLPRIRWAQWHEDLRDRSDTILAETGKRPAVTLVTLGSSRGSAAQADRVRNLLAPAGIATTDGSLDALSAGSTAPPTVVCICAADDVGTDELGAATTSLRAAGVPHVVVACAAPAASVAGADTMIVDGIDALAFQTELLDDLVVAG
jgi:methylmalonyl-CoA mutase